jgi:serine phosphatase RsbU (regulator of sigma subunit)
MEEKEEKVEKGRAAKPGSVRVKSGAAGRDAGVRAAAVKEGALPAVRFSIRIKFAAAIILLVALIILTMTAYMIMEESNVMKDEMFGLAEREIEHLRSNAAYAISSKDELQLSEIIKDLKKIKSVKYAFFLDNDNRILENFNSKLNGTIHNDSLTAEISKYNDPEKPLVRTIPDTEDGGYVYDFSNPLVDKIFKKRLGTVRLGFSDKLIREKIEEVSFNIMVIALAFLGISILGAVVLATIIIRPIKKLSEGAAVIGTGNLNYKIALKSSDEIGRLAFEFNLMTSKLKMARDLEIESRIMQEQLDLAKEIQEGLNPSAFYDMDGIQIKGFTRAAKGVGGDYFDYVNIDDNRVGALLSDVSGKGVPASLVMVMIRTVFVTQISSGDVDCASVVRAINDSLSADFAIDKFATLFFMIYDRSREELSFTNAGHGPLFCFRKAKNACSITNLEGVPIGIMDEAEYRQARIKINPGDIVVLYSDGVTEMRNEQKEEYGRLRLQNLVIANNELSADKLVEMIVSDVDGFRGKAAPHDDMTTLVLKRVR